MPDPVLNLATVLDHNTARRPRQVVLTHGENRLTNQELSERVHALAAGLRETGVGRGDVVAILLTTTSSSSRRCSRSAVSAPWRSR